jgi:hypothetical protein
MMKKVRMFALRFFAVPFCLIAIIGCERFCEKSHKKMTPEEVVEAYLNVAFNMTSVSQRTKLMKYTTGPLREAIAQVSVDTIRRAYIERNYKPESYTVVERRDRTPRETEITFQLVYRELGKDPKKKPEDTPLVTTENTVSVVKEKDLWLIRNVLNKKTTFDFPLAMSINIQGTGKPENLQDEETPPPQDDSQGEQDEKTE